MSYKWVFGCEHVVERIEALWRSRAAGHRERRERPARRHRRPRAAAEADASADAHRHLPPGLVHEHAALTPCRVCT